MIAAITINGIDYLEVLDSESPDETLRQFTLLVRLLRPVPAALTSGNVRITGGVRVTPVGVKWVASADSAPTLTADGLISAQEAAYFSGSVRSRITCCWCAPTAAATFPITR